MTVIEVLSPTNKMPGEGQELYLRKQRDLLRTDVNLVEIDLLRGGERVLVIPPRHLRLEHQTPYHICVRSGCKPQELEVCPIKLQACLPRFRIPLRPTDAAIALDVQLVIDQCYHNGRYGATINYKMPPEPPLTGDDAKWAEELLQTAIANP